MPDAATDTGPLDPSVLARVADGSPWTAVDVVAGTGSTNADLATAARAGAGGYRVLVAEEQTAGRGRLDRSWVAPRRSGLTFSVLLRPRFGGSRLAWVGLAAGLAVVEAVEGLAPPAGRRIGLKWPNDVVAGDRKLAGVLAERVEPDGVVVGVGLNVTLTEAQLPVPQATSLLLEGGPTDRTGVLVAVLRRLGEWYLRLDAVGGDPVASGLAAGYRQACTTLGRDVRVHLAGGDVTGRAVEIDADGCLVVATGRGRRTVTAGDVVHLR